MATFFQTGTETGIEIDSVDFEGVDPRTGTVTSHSATQFVVDFGGGQVSTFAGTGFADFDANGVPHSGTITSVNAADTTVSPASVTHHDGLNIPVATLLALADANDTVGFTNLVFGGDDTETGTSVYDFLSGFGGNDSLSAGAGNDDLRGGAGNDTLDGGAGTDDWAWYDDATSGVTVSLAIAGAQAVGGGLGSDTLIGIEGLFGSSFDDTLIGNAGANYLNGGLGSDILRGGQGDDTLNGDGFPSPLLGIVASSDIADYSDATSGVTVNLSLFGPQAVGGGLGADTLFGIEGLYGSAYNDVLTGNTGSNLLRGGAGDDTLDGGMGGAIDFADYRDAASGVTVSLALAGPQAVGGGLGSDTLINMEGLVGSNFNDVLTGDGGTNVLAGGQGDDTLDGGAGSDIAIYGSASSGVNVSLSIASPQAVGGGLGTDLLISIENLSGSAFDDVLTGDGNTNVLTGLAGNDVLNGGGGNDSLLGGAGNDTLDGGAGIDTASFGDATSGITVNLGISGPQAIGGGLGTDTLIGIENINGSSFNDFLSGDGNANLLAGGLGDDTVDYSGASGGVFVALYKQVWVDNAQVTGGAGTDTLTGIEKLMGSSHNDVFLGSNGNDSIEGGGGNDMIESYLGNDTLSGGDGNDELYGEEGDDTLDGGAGADFLSASFGTDILIGGADNGDDILSGGADHDVLYGGTSTVGGGADHLFGGTGDDLIYTGDGTGKKVFGEEGNDTIYFNGTGDGEVQGGDGNDWIEFTGIGRADIFGEGGDDILKGGAQSDYISAGTGDDWLYGNDGDDRLIGGDGADRLFAGAGNDYLWGGAGADKFYFLDGFSAGQLDTLRDFEDGVDTIYLPSALSGAVSISTSSYGTYVTVATAQGNIALLIEDVTPSHITLGADIQFV